MEVSGVVFRPTQLFHGGFVDAHHAKVSFSGHSSINAVNLVPSNLGLSSCRRSDTCGRPRKWFGIGNSCGFSDNGHLQYYYETTRCSGGKKKKEKEAVKEKNAAEKARIKKKLKYLKGLSRNLLMFPEMGFVGHNGAGDVLVQDDMRKTISETTDILLAQLKQMKALKKKEKKERKEKLKAAQMITMADSESSSSSSSSSESSDSEREVVVNMKQLRSSIPAEPRVEAEPQTSTVQVETPVIPTVTETKAESPLEQVQAEEPILPCQSTPHEEVEAKESNSFQSELSRVLEMQGRIECLSSLTSVAAQECCGSGGCCGGGAAMTAGGGGVAVGASSGRIDVCLGGKCKKMGGAALLEELQRRVGGEGSVVGCKCMGKCRSGPNVRVLSSDSQEKNRGNPLYIGVGLDDVGAIVSNYLGEKNNNLGLVTT